MNKSHFDFDKIVPRRGSRSYKWDSAAADDVLPLWVADMDFRTAPPVIEALERRVRHGIYGYTKVPKEYYDATLEWFHRRHRWQMEREWILYTTGVVPALSALIKALTNPGDRVLVQTPVYNCFFSSIRNNGCELVTSELICENGIYRMDYADMEQKMQDPKLKVMLLCNPHNPVGRVWTHEELTRMGEICLRNGVFVIADEIHCELVHPGHTYTPFASIDGEFLNRSATCLSPTKAFNLAGLQIANIIIADSEIRRRTDRAININEVCDVNPFGVEGLIAAYNEGEAWLDELNGYLYGNYLYMQDFCRKHLPDFPITPMEGTYLAWMDCRALGIPSETLEKELLERARLWLNAGIMYGACGEGFMRWNLACPRSVLDEGLKRFYRFAENLK